MADIGVLPTKNTIRITSSNGDHGTIDGATRAQAGVMTAIQAGKLDDLWARAESDHGAIQILTPAPLVRPSAPTLPINAVTREEMRQALGQLKADVMRDVGQVLQKIRHDITPVDGAASIDNARIERCELALINVADRVEKLEQTIGEIGIAFQEALQAKAEQERAA